MEDKIGLWDWTLLRNLLILILALIGLARKRINPFKFVPRAQWGVLFGRVVASCLMTIFKNMGLEHAKCAVNLIVFFKVDSLDSC